MRSFAEVEESIEELYSGEGLSCRKKSFWVHKNDVTGCEAMIENDRQWMAMVGHFGHDQLRRDGSLFRGLSAVDRCTWHVARLFSWSPGQWGRCRRWVLRGWAQWLLDGFRPCQGSQGSWSVGWTMVNHGEPYRIVSSLQQLLLFCFETCYTGVSQSHIIELVLFLHTSIKVFYQFRLRWHAQQDMRAWHFVLLADWQQSMNSAENRHHTWHFWTHLDIKILLKPSHRRPERRKVQRQVGAPRFWGYAK